MRKAAIWLTLQVYLVQLNTHTYPQQLKKFFLLLLPTAAFCRVHYLSTRETFSEWSLMFAFPVQTELTYQMVSQNMFYDHWECVTEDLDGFACLLWLSHFPRTQAWESWRKRVLFSALRTAPLCSTSLTGESENESSTNTPLLTMKYALATGSFHKTDLVVSRQGDVEQGGSYRSLSGFRGVPCTFPEVLRRQGFGFFPLYSCNALGLIYSVCTGSICRLLWEQLGCPSRGTNPARSP